MKTEDKNYDRSDDGVALLNNNIDAFNIYKQKRRQHQENVALQGQINSLKTELAEMKGLIKILVERETNGTGNK